MESLRLVTSPPVLPKRSELEDSATAYHCKVTKVLDACNADNTGICTNPVELPESTKPNGTNEEIFHTESPWDEHEGCIA